MKGNMIFNVVFGAVGFVVTFLFSIGNNLLMTSMIRGLMSFAIWFLLAFILRWVWGAVSIPASSSALQRDNMLLKRIAEAI
ncbi:hypothetical protein [Paenibacillus pini]|nr:hypothetical protein [Paenibacillus pini]